MKPGETEWMAYVDGELDAAGVARVEAAMREDEALAATIAAQQRLRATLQSAWAPVLEEPVPERLAGMLRTRSPGRRRPAWLALAASLALGVLVASWWQAAMRGELQLHGDAVLARGALAGVLQDRLAAEPATGGITVGLSFRDQEGGYCRSFELQSRGLAGLACHRGADWQVVALAAAAPRDQGLRPAASALPPAVLAEVDARLQGEPLDAAGERRARAAGWR